MKQLSRIVRSARFSLGCLLLAAVPASVFGATSTSTWNGSASALWSGTANWTPNTVPAQQTILAAFNGASAGGRRTIDIAATARNSAGSRFDSSGAAGDGFIFTTATANIAIRICTDGIINNDDDTQEYRVPIQYNSSTGVAPDGLTTPINAIGGNLSFNIAAFASGTTSNALNSSGSGGTFAFNAASGKIITVGGAATPGIIGGTSGLGMKLTKDGAGTLTLAGTAANIYSGGTTINAGIVNANKANALGTGALTLTGGTLNIGANNQSVGAFTNAGGTISGTATITGTGYELKGGTINAKLGGTGNLASRSGTTTLGAVNTYSGTTLIRGSTLMLGIGNAIGHTTGLTLSTNSVLNPGGFDQIMSSAALTLEGDAAIDYAAGASEVALGNSSARTWLDATLNLLNWDPSLTKLRFGTDDSGLTAAQLAMLEHDGSGLGTAQLDPSGYVFFAIPEPSSLALLILGGLAMVGRFHRKI